MSVQGSVGAQRAAEEIRDFVREKIAERAGVLDVVDMEVVLVLREVEKKADEIAKTAADGWY